MAGSEVMDGSRDDIADKVGRRVATIFIALLCALFAYGYLVPLI